MIAERRTLGATCVASNRWQLRGSWLVQVVEVIVSIVEAVRHFACLHTLQFGLHLAIQRLAHLPADLADPAGHRPWVVLVNICEARVVESII